MFCHDQQPKASPFPVVATPDSIATAVFTATLMVKGDYRHAAVRRSWRELLMAELLGNGLPLHEQAHLRSCPQAFSIWSLVLVRVVEDDEDKSACLESLKAGLRECLLPLGMLIDFNSSLVLDGITRVNLKAVVDAVDVKEKTGGSFDEY